MKLTVKAGGVPPGGYIARFLSVEQKPGYEGKPGLLWTWEVVSGPYAGSKATGFTDLIPTTGNKAGRFVAGLTGKPLLVNQEVDLSGCIGKTYYIMCEATAKGGSKVVSVSTPPA